MSVASVLASVTPDKELADRLLAALSSNGISNLRLLESITTSTPIFSAVLNTFAEDESFKDKKGLAGVTLSASAREAGAQLQFALSSAMSSSGRRNPGGQSRLDFSEAIARVKSRYGKIAFMPSAKALEILAKGGLHTYIDFNSMNVSDKGAKKMALTDDGVAVFIQSPDEPSDGSDKGRPKALCAHRSRSEKFPGASVR
ncbi:hypothetical protein FOL46_004394 [Perkinsus olseni]|uniref:Uncharacterized protein n=1 Tax=Perkinsus olseni TaxID=32597 RepID=A0A7J6KKD8_PEROL|nr:hypothetical protein FOL46_004394 [Perkinsus olseni]